MEALETKIKLLLLPTDPNDNRNVMLEIRAGTGGDEAALWAAELLGVYKKYALEQVRGASCVRSLGCAIASRIIRVLSF